MIITKLCRIYYMLQNFIPVSSAANIILPVFATLLDRVLTPLFLFVLGFSSSCGSAVKMTDCTHPACIQVQPSPMCITGGGRKGIRPRLLQCASKRPKRIAFKTAVLVRKAQHGAAPVYLSDFCELPMATVSGRQYLRSASAGVLMVPRARTTTGQWSFAVNGPTVRNSLPAALRAPDRSLAGFKHHLKTYLFEH